MLVILEAPSVESAPNSRGLLWGAGPIRAAEDDADWPASCLLGVQKTTETQESQCGMQYMVCCIWYTGSNIYHTTTAPRVWVYFGI